jgi:hypothetical protein
MIRAGLSIMIMHFLFGKISGPCASPTSHSPYLALCSFYLFPKIKLPLKGKRYDTTVYPKNAINVLKTLKKKDFQECFYK